MNEQHAVLPRPPGTTRFDHPTFIDMTMIMSSSAYLQCIPRDLEVPSALARLGPALKHWRAVNEVKQSAVANEFGVNQATVSRWEKGVMLPEKDQARKLSSLLTAPASSAADSALRALVEQSNEACHLICDITHRLLAVSRPRAAEWKAPASFFHGKSLWRYATEDLEAFEDLLPSLGWDDPVAPQLTVRTRGQNHPELPIREGARKVVRIRLSDGRFARLLTDLPA